MLRVFISLSLSFSLLAGSRGGGHSGGGVHISGILRGCRPDSRYYRWGNFSCVPLVGELSRYEFCSEALQSANQVYSDWFVRITTVVTAAGTEGWVGG